MTLEDQRKAGAAWAAALRLVVAPERVGGSYWADGAAWATTEHRGWLVTLGSAGSGSLLRIAKEAAPRPEVQAWALAVSEKARAALSA